HREGAPAARIVAETEGPELDRVAACRHKDPHGGTDAVCFGFDGRIAEAVCAGEAVAGGADRFPVEVPEGPVLIVADIDEAVHQGVPPEDIEVADPAVAG